ncbi:MAG TPA: zf-HC2 domain-containing protein [Pyrinomonadaceae bacterium]|nr:zf-HC2 domain-containing protein [Pyrinomonadaceae bacterium]
MDDERRSVFHLSFAFEMNIAQNRTACRNEEIAAYVDGDLDVQRCALFEEHVAECDVCAKELKVQQSILRELDSALAEDVFVEMPVNFAQVVAARAKSDLSGVRERHERRRAFRLCVVLAALAVALLGTAAVSESIFAPLRVVWRCCVAIFTFLGHALYDLGAGLAVISRGLGFHLLFESRGLGLLLVLLFVTALFMLRRLIAGYHRARAID